MNQEIENGFAEPVEDCDLQRVETEPEGLESKQSKRVKPKAGQSQRAGKLERLAVAEALRSIWENANHETSSGGLVEFRFPNSPAGKREARSLFDGLNTFRRKIERKKLEHFLLWKQIDSLMLCREGLLDTEQDVPPRVYFKKKSGVVSGRSLVILNAAGRLNASRSETCLDIPLVRHD